MKSAVDNGLGSSATSALTAARVTGVTASSDWATVTLTGPPSARASALAAVGTMANAGAVDHFVYRVAGTGTGPATGAPTPGPASPSGGSPTASVSPTAIASPAPTSASPVASASPAPAPASVSPTAAAGLTAAEASAQIRGALGSPGITFDLGSATLTAHSVGVLLRVAAILGHAPNTSTLIAGYTDNQGTPAGNLLLSQERAQAVRAFLAAHGIAAGRMTAVGYGQSHPVASNDTAAGQQANRRVEFTVQGS